jgi:uncharacterized protein with von Willebrand factor type A (vWA) domain
MMHELGDLDQLEQPAARRVPPGALAEVDIDRARDLLGDDAARSLEQLAELAKMLEEAGLIENKEGRSSSRPGPLRKIGRTRCPTCSPSSPRTSSASTSSSAPGIGHERDLRHQALRVRRPVQPPHRAHVRNAVRRTGGGTPVRLTPEDFEIERTEHLVRAPRC